VFFPVLTLAFVLPGDGGGDGGDAVTRGGGLCGFPSRFPSGDAEGPSEGGRSVFGCVKFGSGSMLAVGGGLCSNTCGFGGTDIRGEPARSEFGSLGSTTSGGGGGGRSTSERV